MTVGIPSLLQKNKTLRGAQMDISVIVPIYNVEEYLEECLNSLYNQEKENLEVILVDDGSTDNSGRIAAAFAEEHPNFYYYRKENGGLGHARNYGASFATGKYLAFVDSDDIVAPDMYRKMFAYAERDQSDLTICNVVRFNSKKVWPSHLHNHVFCNIEAKTHIIECPGLLYDTTSWNKLILRSFYLENQFSFPENILYEDIPVTIPMHYRANRVSVVKSAYYWWRVRDGVSKSITQNVSDLKNLTDRIKVLKMLDRFFGETVSDEKFMLLRQKKTLEIDLMLFLNKFGSIPQRTAQEMLALINEYIQESISEAAFGLLPLLQRQKYVYAANYEIDRLIALTKYQQRDYDNARVEETGGRFLVTVADELFTLTDRDVTKEIAAYEPSRFIDRIEAAGGKIRIFAYLYQPRVSMPETSKQSIQAFLEKEDTAELLRLEATPFHGKKATEKRGTLFDSTTGIASEYNYDGAGFEILIDLNHMEITEEMEGFYNIRICFQNKFSSGSLRLDSASRQKANRAVVAGDQYAKIDYGALNEIRIFLRREHNFAQETAADASRINISLEHEAEEVSAETPDGSVMLFETEDNRNFFAPLERFCDDRKHFLYVKEKNASARPLLYREKKVIIKNRTNPAVFFLTSGTNQIRICLKERVTLVSSMTEAEDTGKIRLTTILLMGDLQLSDAKKAVLYVKDDITGGRSVLAESVCVQKNGKLYGDFFIDFRDEAVTRNLYASTRDLLVSYEREDTSIAVSGVYSRKIYRIVRKMDTLELVCYRAFSGSMRLKSIRRWRQEENTRQKRQALTAKNYPKYRTEEIDPTCIVFESMWGGKYSCNPQHLYEYIDQHYPMYKCVWSLTDERTPIKGNGIRVRRESQEYYHYLATAKYFVNNVNFETGYVKRKGQIEIQTMHGTPLKTLGLDVESDFPNEQTKETYIQKNARWDYLLVQGEFMKNKAYDCFRFEKEVLECGYPRTDLLFQADEGKILKIKESLGLPLQKKVILYAPTWREKGSFDMQLELDKVKEALGEEYILLVRLHHLCAPNDNIRIDQSLQEFVFDLHAYKSVEELYLISDILITDYSSVMFDYALLKRPMIFYLYDLADYRDRLRGLYVDIEKEAPGPIVFDTEAVIGAIVHIEEEMKQCREKIAAFQEKYLGYENGSSCETIVEQVLKPNKWKNTVSRMKRKMLK